MKPIVWIGIFCCYMITLVGVSAIVGVVAFQAGMRHQMQISGGDQENARLRVEEDRQAEIVAAEAELKHLEEQMMALSPTQYTPRENFASLDREHTMVARKYREVQAKIVRLKAGGKP